MSSLPKFLFKRADRSNVQQLKNVFTKSLSNLESHPITFLLVTWNVLAAYTAWFTLRKIDYWIDRTDKSEWRLPPFDWQRCSDHYWKLPIATISRKWYMKRLPAEYENLQNEMIKAAQQRGTRKVDTKAAPSA